MDLVSDDLLRQILIHLHPLKLSECKLVSKRWCRLIIQPETAKWFFFSRYYQPPPEGITYWEQYYPLPGAEKYRSVVECYNNALYHKNKQAGDYFFELEEGKVYSWHSVFQLPSGSLTREQLEYARSFIPRDKNQINYVPSFNYFREYGVLVGLHGDLQFFEREYAKVPVNQLQSFSEGFIKGLCLDGHPKIGEIFAGKTIKVNGIRLYVDCNSADIVFRKNYPGIEHVVKHLTPYHAFRAKVPLLDCHELLDYIMEYVQPHPDPAKDLLCQVVREKEKLGLDKYIYEHYPDCSKYLSTPRFWILRKTKDGYGPRRAMLYQIYHQVILDGDWDIYDKFVDVFYPKRVESTRRKNGRPRQYLIYKPIYQLIADGRLKRLFEVITRLDRLYVTKREVFFRHCLYAAIKYGKKDLVEYFLSCLKKPERVFPLPRKRNWPEMCRYLDEMNNRFRNNLLFLNTPNSSETMSRDERQLSGRRLLRKFPKSNDKRIGFVSCPNLRSNDSIMEL